MDNWGFRRNGISRFFARGVVKQLLAAIVIFFVCVGILSFEGTFSREFYRQVAHYLTSQESDWAPVIETMVATGLWMDTINTGAFQVVAPRDNTPNLALPVSGKIVREFGWIEDASSGQRLFHSGIDIETEIGTSIRAALDGQVIKVDVNDSLGRLVMIEHRGGLITVYANCSEILVEEGDIITQGQIIAKAGESISGNGQLHFEIREGQQLVDPLEFLNLVIDESP